MESPWDFWPLNVLTPTLIDTYLNGYGINPITTWLSDVTWWPRTTWNTFFGVLFGLVNWIPVFIGYVLSILTFLFESPVKFIGYFQWAWRYFSHWADFESFVVVAALAGACGGLAYWAMDASGMLAEMMGGDAAAPADGAAKTA